MSPTPSSYMATSVSPASLNHRNVLVAYCRCSLKALHHCCISRDTVDHVPPDDFWTLNLYAANAPLKYVSLDLIVNVVQSYRRV